MEMGKPRKIITVEPDETALQDEAAELTFSTPEDEQAAAEARDR